MKDGGPTSASRIWSMRVISRRHLWTPKIHRPCRRPHDRESSIEPRAKLGAFLIPQRERTGYSRVDLSKPGDNFHKENSYTDQFRHILSILLALTAKKLLPWRPPQRRQYP